MHKPQSERDALYLAALAIFKTLHRKGVITESELVKIDSFLAEKFSASLAVRTPEIACI